MTGGFFVAFLAVARHGKNVYDEEKSVDKGGWLSLIHI